MINLHQLADFNVLDHWRTVRYFSFLTQLDLNDGYFFDRDANPLLQFSIWFAAALLETRQVSYLCQKLIISVYQSLMLSDVVVVTLCHGSLQSKVY